MLINEFENSADIVEESYNNMTNDEKMKAEKKFKQQKLEQKEKVSSKKSSQFDEELEQFSVLDKSNVSKKVKKVTDINIKDKNEQNIENTERNEKNSTVLDSEYLFKTTTRPNIYNCSDKSENYMDLYQTKDIEFAEAMDELDRELSEM